jgi:hypothetical protein
MAVLFGQIAVQRGAWASFDGRLMASVSRSIWAHHALIYFGDSYGATPGAPYGFKAVTGLGQSLLLAPFWLIQFAIGERSAPLALTWLNPVVFAVTAAVLVRIGDLLGWRPRTSALVGLGFGLATMTVLYSTELFVEPALTLCSTVAVLGVVHLGVGRAESTRQGSWLLGGAVGAAIVLKVDAVLTVGCIAFVLLAKWRTLGPQWRLWSWRIGVPVCAGIAVVAWYNFYRWGIWWSTGYDQAPGSRGFDTPLAKGIAIVLWSPGKGLFVYNPLLIAALPGIVLLWRRHRMVAACIVVVLVVRTGLYARWWVPDGNIAWGPRFHLPMCALLMVAVGQLIDELPALRRTARSLTIAALVSLASLGVGANVASVAIPYELFWSRLNDTSSVAPNDRQRELDRRYEATYWEPGMSPLVINARELINPRRGPNEPGRRSTLYWWRDRREPIGLALLIGCIAMSVLVVRRARPDKSDPSIDGALVPPPFVAPPASLQEPVVYPV